MTGQALMAQGIGDDIHRYVRVRLPVWANPEAYARFSLVKIQLPGGAERLALGPWMHLYDRPTQEAIEQSTPQVCSLIVQPGGAFNFLETDWEVYTGALDPADN